MNADTRRLFDDGGVYSDRISSNPQKHHDETPFDSLDNDLASLDIPSTHKARSETHSDFHEAGEDDDVFAELNDDGVNEIGKSHPPPGFSGATSDKLNASITASTRTENNQQPYDRTSSSPSISINNEYGELFIDQPEFNHHPKPITQIEHSLSHKSYSKTKPFPPVITTQFQSSPLNAVSTSAQQAKVSSSPEDDDLLVLEVQKNQPVVPPKKSEGSSKLSNKSSIGRSKYNFFGASKGSHNISSDRFLDPLLASISKIQMEKNVLQSEYAALNLKYAKASTQLEKTLGVVSVLKRRVEAFGMAQTELQDGLKDLQDGIGAKVPCQVNTMKSESASIDISIKEIGNSLNTIRLSQEQISDELHTVKMAQTTCNERRLHHVFLKAY